ncbi:MAG TPA: hypothetical protein VKO43_06330 [Candidatus Krumholzibacteriaceae bacterium]|nr:hypothetical protein [Candidatus Krumholzibacteriaceae bacterium]
MKKLWALMIVVLIFSGFGCEGVFSSKEIKKESFSDKEVKLVALESAGADSVTVDVTLYIGAQLLESNFKNYSQVAYDKNGNFCLPQENSLSSSLERLYQDLDDSIN